MNGSGAPRRLTDCEGGDPFASRLLSSGKKDRPTNDQVSRAVALALASNAVVPGTPSPPAPAAAVGSVSALKIGLTVIGLSAIGAMGYLALAPGRASPSSVASTSVAPAAPPASEVAPPASTEHSISVSDLPTAPPVVTERPAAIASVPRANDSSPGLRDELVKLQAARRLLREGNASGSLVELAGYRREFPNGSLRAEEAALRIDAEVAAGDAARAKADAERFGTDFPTSPESPRIRALGERLVP